MLKILGTFTEPIFEPPTVRTYSLSITAMLPEYQILCQLHYVMFTFYISETADAGTTI